MRPLDLAAAALVLAAGLFVVEATWTPPLVDPSDAPARIGERVQMEGMAMELRRFGDGSGRMVLSAAGAAVHVRLADVGPLQENDWVRVEGTLRRDGGLPVLEAESRQVVARPAGQTVQVSAVAAAPHEHVDRLLRLQGFVERGHIEDDGHQLALDGDVEPGFRAVDGVLRYAPRCLCYTLHVAWT